jgi:hypothetical protein
MRILAAMVALLAAFTAAAQVMYRSTMPDGRIVLSDRPMPGAKKVEEIQPPAGNVVGAQPPVAPARPEAKPAEKPAVSPVAAAENELRDAQRAYDAAREAKEKGVEALPGERRGLVGGGSRLTEDYWARQKALEDAVAAAEKRLQAAREQLRQLR